MGHLGSDYNSLNSGNFFIKSMPVGGGWTAQQFNAKSSLKKADDMLLCRKCNSVNNYIN